MGPFYFYTRNEDHFRTNSKIIQSNIYFHCNSCCISCLYTLFVVGFVYFLIIFPNYFLLISCWLLLDILLLWWWWYILFQVGCVYFLFLLVGYNYLGLFDWAILGVIQLWWLYILLAQFWLVGCVYRLCVMCVIPVGGLCEYHLILSWLL